MSTPQRLPIVNSDDGTWGDIIRQYLKKEHYDDGTDNAVNGGHQNITVRAGTATAGTAPLKFTSGTLLTVPEAGATEFNSDSLYFTITTGTVRKRVAMYDDSSGATGDLHYRNSSGNLVRLGIGSTGQALTVASGLPAWGTVAGSTFAVSTKTTSYTITTSDTVILADSTSGNVIITLPAASGVTGYHFYVKRLDNSANSVAVSGSGSDAIDSTTRDLTLELQYDTVEVVSDGTAWYILRGTEQPPSAAPITLRAFATATQAASSSVVCNKPTGTIAGDVMIAYFTIYPGATTVTFTPPTGWTAIGSLTSYTVANQIYSQACYRVAGSAEPTTYTFTSTVAKPCDVAIMSFEGVDNITPIDGSSGNSGTGTTRTGTSITTTNGNDMLLFLSSGFTGSTVSSGPSGMTLIGSYGGPINYLYDKTLTTAGATGSITATQTPTNSWTVNMVALKPSGSDAVLDFYESFESGANGAVITTANSSFDVKFAGGSATFDNSTSVNGTQSAKYVSTGVAGNAVYLQRSFTAAPLLYLRFAALITSLPPSPGILVLTAASSGNTDAFDIRINAAGTVSLRNNTIAIATSTTTVPVGSWFVIEANVNTATSLQTARIYSSTSTSSLQETFSGLYNQGSIISLKYGIASTLAATIWLDAVSDSFTDWISGTEVNTTIFPDPVMFDSTVDIEGSTTVNGHMTLSSGLTVSAGGATIAGGAGITGTTAVTGSSTVSTNLTITGALGKGNDFWDNPSITPSGIGPTNSTETYPALKGTGTIYAQITGNTTVPGDQGTGAVQGVSASSVTSTSATLWINRVNNTTTGVWFYAHRDIT